MAFIRPFKPEDTEACKHICRATLPPSLAASPAAVKLAPYLWTLQFTHLFPEHCFVLDDGEGTAVGYVLGAPDVFALQREYPRYIAEVLAVDDGGVPVPRGFARREPWTVTTTTGAEGSNGRGGGGGGEENGAGQSQTTCAKEEVVNGACLAQLAYKVEWLIGLDSGDGDGAVEGKEEMVRGWRAMMHIDLLEGYQGKGWGRQMIERFVESVRRSGCDYGRGIQIGVAGENDKVVGFYEKVGFRVYPGGEKEGNVWMVRDL
ncbi:acyl-CoA N-acyltransferase [Canariomyces notabilis]|uniref:Acyl-CoA N-acyltransferase n=1 Tax=Canariomyces notabilis TaxID=2074819 RepID=A0AAN6TEI8_9PEZI|nr:acyl-CoA N-acyltransferase [Canariomyces arenarius]